MANLKINVSEKLSSVFSFSFPFNPYELNTVDNVTFGVPIDFVNGQGKTYVLNEVILPTQTLSSGVNITITNKNTNPFIIGENGSLATSTAFWVEVSLTNMVNHDGLDIVVPVTIYADEAETISDTKNIVIIFNV